MSDINYQDVKIQLNLYAMKRFCIFLLVVGLSISAFAQYDDIYDSGTYKSNKGSKGATNTTRTIDEYNRVGTTEVSVVTDSVLNLGEDYKYTKEIIRFYDPEVVNIENAENVYVYNYTDPEEEANSSANVYVNLGWTNWYSPWYYDSWFTWNSWGSIWYDPWYDPFWVHPYSPYPGYYPYSPYRPYPYRPYPYCPPHHPHHPAPRPHDPGHHHGPSHHHGPTNAHTRDYDRGGNSRGNTVRPESKHRNTDGTTARPTNTRRNTDNSVSRSGNTNRNTTTTTRGGRGNTNTGTVTKRNTTTNNGSVSTNRGGGSRSNGTVTRGGGNSRSGGAATRGGRR